MAKTTISIRDDLMARADEVADSLYMTRSGLISAALSQYLLQFEVQEAIKNLSLSIAKIDPKDGIDPETMHQLEDFQRLAGLFVGK